MNFPALTPGVRSWLKVVQAIFLGLVLLFITLTLKKHWGQVSQLDIQPNFFLIIFSVFLIWLSSGLWIRLWAGLLKAYSGLAPFWSLVRLWAHSNLYRYVPGKIWQAGYLIIGARQLGLDGPAAFTTSVAVTALALLAAVPVLLLTGWPLRHSLEIPHTGWFLFAAFILFCLLLPFLATRLRSQYRLAPQSSPWSAYLICFLGHTVGWVISGLAFHLFVVGLLGHPLAGATPLLSAIFIYTWSYFLGSLALFAPGGLGVREAVMIALLPLAGLTSPAEAVAVALASRLWLIFIEILPGLIYLAFPLTPQELKGDHA